MSLPGGTPGGRTSGSRSSGPRLCVAARPFNVGPGAWPHGSQERPT
jgi:hypothetical protein